MSKQEQATQLCNFCRDALKKPVTLECSHNVCLECAERMFSLEMLNNKYFDTFALINKCNSEPKIEKEYIPVSCMQCNSKTNIDKAYGASMLPKLNVLIAQTVKKCVNECGREPTVECINCNSPYCQACYAAVHAIPALKKHQSVKVGELDRLKPQNCSKHAQELNIYCISCDTICCVICASYQHKDHTTAPISEYYEQLHLQLNDGRTILRQKSQLLKDRIGMISLEMSNLQILHSNLLKKIEDEFKEVLQAVLKRKSELVKACKHIEDVSEIALKQQIEALKNVHVYANQMENSLTPEILEKQPHLQLAIAKQQLAHFLHHTDGKILPSNPCRSANTYSVFDKDALMRLISSFGSFAVPDVPSVPTIVRIDQLSAHSVQVHWTPSLPNGSPILNYKLLMVTEEEQVVYSGKEETCVVINLQPLQTYHFKVQAKNSIGEGLFSEVGGITMQRMFNFSHDMDENGILYYYGTNAYSKPFNNPAMEPNSKVDVTRFNDSSYGGDPRAFTGRDVLDCVTANKPFSWFQIYFKFAAIQPSYYTIRNDKSGRYAVRMWHLEASVDGKAWDVLRIHNNDMSLKQEPGSCASFKLESDKFYSYFRILQTGRNAMDKDNLALSGFELYGIMQ